MNYVPSGGQNGGTPLPLRSFQHANPLIINKAIGGRAFRSGRRGRGFESRRPDH